MSLEAGHISGGAPIYMRFPVRASMLTAGVPAVSITDAVGLNAATTTVAQDAVGLAVDTATYSTTQADLDDGEPGGAGPRGVYSGLDMGRVVTVSVRPDLLIKSLMSSAAAAGTALVELNNTVASAGGTLITDADVGANDMVSGTVWCIRGANVGHARVITTHTGSVSFTVTVPFPRAIAVGDRFLFCPYTTFGTFAASLDGSNAAQFTTNIDQVNASIASGTGAEVLVVKMDLEAATNSYVYYMLRDHQWNRHTVPA